MKAEDVPPKLDQMIFIYNSLMNGWTVCSNGENSFEFTKKKNKKEIDLGKTQISQFILENI